MLSPTKIKELTLIAQLACDCLSEWGWSKFLLEGVRWDDANSQWLVDFYSKARKSERISVSIQPYFDTYRYTGVVFR